MTKSAMSYIEEHEEEDAKRIIRESVISEKNPEGFDFPPPGGFQMMVKIYVRPEDMKEITTEDGRKIALYLPETVRVEDKFRNCSGLVVAMGPDCYVGKDSHGNDRYPSGAWCKVGDFICFPRNVGTQISYRGVPVQIIPDDKLLFVTPDPTYVTRD